ncbi:oxygen-independent coproporphyrinogen III oxidase [Caulobacter sp. KR2-114]|uniref:oxygen-independent coproporphyrinogen III oxidase n=1 Tax=Caulobacter sp. KR2-114 TaxID=3400912 RepID=UPI003C0E4E82
MTVVDRTAAMQLRRLSLLPKYDGRAPRYTSYPTAVQFTGEIDADRYGAWLGELAPDEAVSIYAHIPFCARLCWFCGCNTRVVTRQDPIHEYVRLLQQEIGMVRERLPGRLRAREIHLGGGTPNMLSPGDLELLFGALRDAFEIIPGAEIAAELDPLRLTDDWISAAAAQGLTRASLGVQDLSPDVQAAVNRHEPFGLIRDAAHALRAAGVGSLNLDLMYGLPRQRTADVLNTLDQVLTLHPDRIALFGYAHVPWVKPHQKLINDKDLPGAAERLDQSQAAADRLAAEGYVAIGLDHFARPGDSLAIAAEAGEIRRNFQGYTTDGCQTLIGFGASAIGHMPQGFVQNQSAELAWRQAIEAGRLATARGAVVTEEDRFRGEIIEELMCRQHVDLEAVCRRHGRALADLADELAALEGFVEDGVVFRHGPLVTVTPMGAPFLRSVCAVFDAYLDRSLVRHSVAV